MTSENQIKNMISDFMKSVDQDLKDFTPLQKIASKYNQNPVYIALGVTAIFILFAIFGLFGHTFVTIFGLVYPAYMSFKAINLGSEDISTKWLTYWIIFGVLTAFDRLIGVILFFLPMENALKIVFFIWLFYPRTNGALYIYQNFFKQFLMKLRNMSEGRQ